ncbi:Hypothetical_protein [Hexamita inflata]|uniref:Hypothetical_protein n=1 Tax=Hexamita inflata TaxID=28002 RepID=A0AA86US27_9EUKA|nr:Hypothetical protein HINF_LOCUS35583 [Hexamita inflata]
MSTLYCPLQEWPNFEASNPITSYNQQNTQNNIFSDIQMLMSETEQTIQQFQLLTNSDSMHSSNNQPVSKLTIRVHKVSQKITSSQKVEGRNHPLLQKQRPTSRNEIVHLNDKLKQHTTIIATRMRV